MDDCDSSNMAFESYQKSQSLTMLLPPCMRCLHDIRCLRHLDSDIQLADDCPLSTAHTHCSSLSSA